MKNHTTLGGCEGHSGLTVGFDPHKPFSKWSRESVQMWESGFDFEVKHGFADSGSLSASETPAFAEGRRQARLVPGDER